METANFGPELCVYIVDTTLACVRNTMDPFYNLLKSILDSCFGYGAYRVCVRVPKPVVPVPR